MATEGTPKETEKSLYDGITDVVMRGTAIIIPAIVTLYLLKIALDFVNNALGPFILLLEWLGLIDLFEHIELIRLLIDLGIYSLVIDFLSELIAIATLFGIIVFVGTVGHNRYGEQVIRYIDLAIISIPGLGTVYRSFRRMGDIVLDDEADNFKEIKLVEALGEDMYVLGFETSRSPAAVTEAAGHEEMITLFIPMAPNPVTGGFLTYVPESRVTDLDMTIEEGVRSILTSGVAVGERADETPELAMGDLERITDVDSLQDAFIPEEGEDE